MARFLHTADWQIGRQYPRFLPEDGGELFEARFRTVERIAQMAAENAVDAVLVAGDVFDAQGVSERTIRRLFNALTGYTGPWVMIPGNHDAALAESVWTRAERLGVVPDNVHVLTRPEVLELPAAGFAVLPAPLTQRHTYQDLTQWFDSAATAPGLLRIGVAHGSVEGVLAEDIDSANPVASERVVSARLDYLALGDWHGLKKINDRAWYSGTPEQERFKDNDAGFVLMVTCDQAGAIPLVEAHEVTQYRWHQRHFKLAVASDVDRCLRALEEIPTPSVVYVTLEGETDLAGFERLQRGLRQQEARHRSLQWNTDRVRFLPTEEDLKTLQVDGYVKDVVAQLRDRQQGDDEDVARDALTILAGLLLDPPAEKGERR